MCCLSDVASVFQIVGGLATGIATFFAIRQFYCYKKQRNIEKVKESIDTFRAISAELQLYETGFDGKNLRKGPEFFHSFCKNIIYQALRPSVSNLTTSNSTEQSRLDNMMSEYGYLISGYLNQLHSLILSIWNIEKRVDGELMNRLFSQMGLDELVIMKMSLNYLFRDQDAEIIFAFQDYLKNKILKYQLGVKSSINKVILKDDFQIRCVFWK